MSQFDPTTRFEPTLPVAPPAAPTAQPQLIGRYRIERVLGRGGFGLVYLAHDEQLDRRVAIKVPHARLVSRAADADAYLTEARTVAHLDHPHIVPVYDLGSTDEYACYVVSRYVEGSDLSLVIRQKRPGCLDSALLIATMADALHYAHTHGIVHRDIKPGNILIDAAGQPYLVDFGLALREQQFGKGPQYAGTPSYMSPEQARGEGHRVDGRSDIFSLGVVFYMLLVGRKPFESDNHADLLEQILSLDPRPPRQVDDRIPRELERICLKAMSKRSTERYSTAKDFCGDLRHFLSQHPRTIPENSTASASVPGWDADTSRSRTDSATADTGSPPLRIVPKGLRSFDERDSDFFLELLPGPRDREGLPDLLRFWKARIEERDADQTFAVGLLYGPSGCGKSSLMRAGLLPRLADHVTAVFVEAAPEETERRLLNALHKHFPALPGGLSLKETVAALRSGDLIPEGRKLLIVLDQFEQWLHARKDQAEGELVQALRQCDGGLVQCLVLVRDDFWLAATRFMGALEVDLLQGQNTALADLFDLRHGRKVLAAFGRAFGALPDNPGEMTKQQRQFLDQAVTGLAEDGRIVCVRLALFAEMVKGKPWSPATWKQVGGTQGVGIAFLEETFSSHGASPKHRWHQQGARAVLNALLPAAGAEIKGNLRSYEELLEASGYSARVREFDELLRILDRETRLITPTDPEGSQSAEDSVSHPTAGQRYYQLTHDYLVPSLREWLTRKQKETRRGRAELRLAERSALWKAKPENRHLPSSWECLNIGLWTRRKDWTQGQRAMMGQAARFHGLRWSAASVGVVAVALAAQQYLAAQKNYLAERENENQRQRAELLVDALLTAPADAVPYAIKNLEPLREHGQLMLEQRFDDSRTEPARRLRAAVALAEFGNVQQEFLVSSIPDAPAGECANLVAALKRDRGSTLGLLHQRAGEAERRKAWPEKARLATVALHLGDATIAKDMFALRADPIQRSVLIAALPAWHGAVDELLATSANEAPDFRSGICLGMGGIAPDETQANSLNAARQMLLAWYQDQPDAGTHSASGWALRQWNVPLPEPAASEPRDGRAWHVNRAGMTMLRIPAGSFTRKTTVPDPRDPSRTKSQDQAVTLGEPFWLCDREISIRVFQQFIDDPDCPSDEKPQGWKGPEPLRSPTAEHPVQQVNWIDAVLFCNWLSRTEGRQPCYRRNGAAWELLLDADGYRLPLESEWEHACRAGTTTMFSSGDDESLLSQYAVYQQNHTEVCGSKRPNGWGLFDIHGNVFEWCQEWYESPPSKQTNRVLRGGAFDYLPKNAVSSRREGNRMEYRSFTIGFRPARAWP